MAINIDIKIPAGAARADRTGHKVPVPAFTLSIGLDGDGTWRLVGKPHPRWSTVVSLGYGGSWSGSVIGIIYVMDDKGDTLIELRDTGAQGRLAFFWPRKGNYGAVLYDGQSTWKPSSAVETHAWIGLVGKGSMGAGISGEVSVAAMFSAKGAGTVLFKQTSGRLGAVLGAAGGWGIIFATGFPTGRDFDGYTSDGLDYSVAVGTRLKAIANPKLVGLASKVQGIDGKFEALEGLIRGTNPKLAGLRNEIPNLAKTIKDSVLCDPQVKSMVCIDLPGLPGAELGVFYKWDSITVIRSH